MPKLNNSRRLSKFKRKPLEEVDVLEVLRKPILTKRDKEVLLATYYHRCLTTTQIAELLFKYQDNGRVNSQAEIVARRRIRKLYDYRLIDRFFIEVGENNGSSPAHVTLDALGARVVAGMLNCRVEDLNWRQEMNTIKLPYLQHMIEVNNFYIYLLRKARELGHDILEYRTENLTRYEFKYWGSKVVFNPDAYGQYFYGEEGFHFFLELDRGTMGVATFQKKHDRYTAFYASDEYLKYFASFPLVLTVTPNMERAEQLRHAIYAIDNTDIQWLFTSEELAKDNPLGRIWLGKEKAPIALI